jgi:membrane-associated protease RseP (regulator of RpoE activity)
MFRRTLCRLAAVGALILMPTSVLAQSSEVRVVAESSGWIGISIDVRTQTSRDGTRAIVVVAAVNEGGPARAAGLRAGDVLLRINDIRDVSGFQNVSSRLHLDPGDPVRIEYLRDGQRHRVDLTAGDRSRPIPTSVYTFRFQPDSMVETAFRAMNSLRVRMLRARGSNLPRPDEAAASPDPVIARIRTREVVAPVAEPTRPDVRWLFPESLVDLRSWETQEVRAPSMFFVFPGEQHDSLQREMDDLNDSFRRMRSLEEARERELRSISGTLRGNEHDNQLLRIRGLLEELSRRSSGLRRAMEEETVSTASGRYGIPSMESVWEIESVREIEQVRGEREAERDREATASFRPLAPYLLGQNRVVGAEVIDLRPELAAYFDVDGGVLVTDVPSHTPAADAGIKPGDVITRIDDVAVRSVQGLRLALSRADTTISMTLVRQGQTRTILLRR